jgi:hypothetical protein
MASPIQIILNDRDYEQARDVGGGGPRKDFFANRDKEFRQHKAALMASSPPSPAPSRRRARATSATSRSSSGDRRGLKATAR